MEKVRVKLFIASFYQGTEDTAWIPRKTLTPKAGVNLIRRTPRARRDSQMVSKLFTYTRLSLREQDFGVNFQHADH